MPGALGVGWREKVGKHRPGGRPARQWSGALRRRDEAPIEKERRSVQPNGVIGMKLSDIRTAQPPL